MSKPRKVRMSMVVNPLLSPTNSGQHRMSISTVDSDDEWARMQKGFHSDMLMVEQADEEALNALRDAKMAENREQIMTIIESIDHKTEQVSQLQEELADIEDRFIWDLALAFKRCLVEEKRFDTYEGLAISNLSVSTILDRAIEEAPLPHEWGSWITHQYVDAY